MQEKPLATTIERDILPESLEIDGATHVRLDSSSSDVDPVAAQPIRTAAPLSH